MKPFVTALMVAVVSLMAVRADARDSTCLLGDDGKIAVTTLEHRADNSRRATEVTLIFGAHLLRGRLKDTDSGKITLQEKDAGKDAYTFSGTISIDYKKMRITLKGKLKFAPDLPGENLNTSFKCKELQPQ